MGVFNTTARPITLVLTGAGLTYEAAQAAIAKVKELEDLYAYNVANVTDLTAATVVLTGLTPYKIFVFTVTTVMADAEYDFDLVEIAPNNETATSL